MFENLTDGCRVLTRRPVEQGSEIERVNSFDELRDERLFGSLRELEGEAALAACLPLLGTSLRLDPMKL